MSDQALRDRVPPQNLEAERSVIGSMLRANKVIGDIVTFLKVEDFYTDAHRKLYETITQHHNKGGQPVDLVILAEELQQRGWLEDVGGPRYLAELWDAAPTAANAEYYGRIVRGQVAGALADRRGDGDPGQGVQPIVARRAADRGGGGHGLRDGVQGDGRQPGDAGRSHPRDLRPHRQAHLGQRVGPGRVVHGLHRAERADCGLPAGRIGHHRRSAIRWKDRLQLGPGPQRPHAGEGARLLREPGAVADRTGRAPPLLAGAGGRPSAAQGHADQRRHGAADRGGRHPPEDAAVHRRLAAARHAAHRRQRPAGWPTRRASS